MRTPFFVGLSLMMLVASLGLAVESVRSPSEAEKAAAKPEIIPGKDPKGTAAAYAKKWTGCPAFTQPLLFNTAEADAVLRHVQVFPADSPFYDDVSQLPVAPNSTAMIAGMNGRKNLAFNSDMNYVLVPVGQRLVDAMLTAYPNESDTGPWPIPDNAPIEGWNPDSGGELPATQARVEDGDRHLIVIDPAAGLLMEFWQARRTPKGWQASCEATFDLKTNALRPDGWTSSDAAGLPIFPLTVRYDDLTGGIVPHAMRFTARATRAAYVYPATHKASRRNDAHLPRMGERFRLKADVDISRLSPAAQAVAKGLKKYGMICADNGGDWRISVAPDPRIKGLEDLGQLKASDFEVVVPLGPHEGSRAQAKAAR